MVTYTPDASGFRTKARPSRVDVLRRQGYLLAKRGFDLVFSTVVLLPAMLVVATLLLVLNPIYNPGPLFFRQIRMGRGCKPFWAFKFRTMRVARNSAKQCRPIDAPVEKDRITAIGNFLRRSRFDELPQIINVYRGDMSLIGPRPDYYVHAHRFMRTIPDYRDRHTVRPGISGLAQIELGYAEGYAATRLKTASDIEYIRKASFKLDTWILWQTIRTVVGMHGE